MRHSLRLLAAVTLAAGVALPAASQHIIGTTFVGGFIQLVDVNPATGALG